MEQLIDKLFGEDHLWIVFLDLELFIVFIAGVLYLTYLAITGRAVAHPTTDVVRLDVDLIPDELYQLLLTEFYNQNPELDECCFDNWEITAEVDKN